MARVLKPQKVDQVWNRITGRRLEVMLDRNKLVFFVEDKGQRFCEEKTAEACKEKAQALVDSAKPLEWQQVILISLNEKFDTSERFAGMRGESKFDCQLSLEFKRLEVSTVEVKARYGGATKKAVERAFLDDDGLTDSDFRHLPEDPETRAERIQEIGESNRRRRRDEMDIYDHYDRGGVVLPYDPQVWTTLHAIRSRIGQAHQQLADLLALDQKKLVAKLLDVQVSTQLQLVSGENK